VLKQMYDGSIASHSSSRGYNNTRNLRDDRESFEDWLTARELNSLLNALSYGRGGSIHYDDFLQYALSPEDGEKEPIMEIHGAMQKYCTKNKLKAKDLTRYFSTSRTAANGYITVSDFETVLVRKMKVSNDDFEKLVRRWDWNNDGTVDHNNFVAWLFSGYNTDELATRFTHQLSMFEVGFATKSIERMLGRNGTMSATDFCDLCDMELGMVFSACEQACLYKMLDEDNKEKVEVEDILAYHKNQTGGAKKKSGGGRDKDSIKLNEDDALLPRMLRDDLTEAVLGFLREGASDGGASLGKLICDNNNDTSSKSTLHSVTNRGGRNSLAISDVALTRKDFRRVLSSLSLKLREEEENTIFESFDFNAEGVVRGDDLLCYLLGLALDTCSQVRR
jgi:Ca2+-binding EF-hand superfamily protein